MKKIIFPLLVVLSTMIACKKNAASPSTSTDKYMSLTANSTWSYEVKDNVAADSINYSITSTTVDSTINGKAYHVFTNSAGVNQYYNITGNDYYTFQKLPVTFGTTAVENIYLKDNIAAAGSWNQPYTITVSGLPLTVNLLNTITEKDISKTVNGIVYNNVIHVTTTLTVSLFGTPLPAGAITTNIEAYYAPKVGMIQSRNKINIDFSGNTDNIDQETYLKHSDIK